MKPTSIVFIVVSVLLIVAGLITCSIAQSSAAQEDIQLFPEYADGTSKMVVKFEKADVTKIDIIVNDANVNIIGGAEESYIEVINYKPNFYALTTTSRVLSFNEIPDLKTMMKFWETGFSFTGIRNILNSLRTDLGQKVINVYLTNDHDINQFNVSIDKGSLMIADIHTNGSFDLSVSSGYIKMDNVTTTDVLSIKSDTSVNVSLSNTSASTANVAMKAADFIADNVVFTTADVSSETGKISYMTSLIQTAYNISTGGKIDLWGQDMPDGIPPVDHTNGSYTFKLTLKSTSADISITFPETPST